MSDLAGFLAARLGEKEATAKCAAMWQQEGHAVFVAHYGAEWGAIDDYDPARVLREVDAKRKILAEYVAVRRLTGLTEADRSALIYREWTCRNLAAVWSDHADYDPAWA